MDVNIQINNKEGKHKLKTKDLKEYKKALFSSKTCQLT